MYCWRFFMRSKYKTRANYVFIISVCSSMISHELTYTHTHTQKGYYVNAFALHATRARKDNETKDRERVQERA